ncbi:MAG TPA: GntR family transcriptional regulator [Nitrolancea sp.]|nr:GntR family transcriptional regulator [Nitrolancea sp.]
MSIEEFVSDVIKRIDSSSRVPLYEQIAQHMLGAIQRGELAPGTVLPPEPELAEQLGVSRQTVNQALTSLARRGLLNRRRGVGTFIVEPYIEQPLDGLYSFIRTLTAQGRLPNTRILGYRLTIDEQASSVLTGSHDGLVYEISRLRLVDDEPFVLETIYLPVECGEKLPLDRMQKEALHELLRKVCDVEVTHADETLRPVRLETVDAALLGLAAGDPAFLVERIGFSDDQPVELRRSLIRGDRYRFRVRLSGATLS